MSSHALPPEQIPTFIADFLESDLNLMAFANSRGIHPNTAYRWFRDQGIAVPDRPRSDRVERPDLEVLSRKFSDGASVKQLASDYGVNRSTVARWLDIAKVQRRDRSAAMFVRMAAASPEERMRLVAAAHEARRGKPRSESESHHLAIARQVDPGIIGLGEEDVRDRLAARNVSTVQQVPVGPYNIDVACWPVAVEVHRNTKHPARWELLRERTAYLVDHGWRVLYVWCGPGARNGTWCVSPPLTGKIVHHIASAQADPAAVEDCHVLRCTGVEAH